MYHAHCTGTTGFRFDCPFGCDRAEAGLPSDSAMKHLGGSHAVIVAADSMPGPNSDFVVPPMRPSNLVGTNQDEIPGQLQLPAKPALTNRRRRSLPEDSDVLAGPF
jgi:hypothetical protein